LGYDHRVAEAGELVTQFVISLKDACGFPAQPEPQAFCYVKEAGHIEDTSTL
jgi:hypothetical protein